VREHLGSFGRGLALVMALSPPAAAAHLALVAAVNLLPVAQAWLAKLVVDRVAAASPGPALALAGLYAATLIAASAVRPPLQALSAWLQERALGEVDRRLIDAGTRLADLDRIERPSALDELRTLREQAYYPPRLFVTLEQGPGTLLTMAGLAVLLARLHPLLPILVGGALTLHLVGQYRLNRMQWEARRELSRAARETDYCVRLVTDPVAAKEVRVFGLGGYFRERFRTHADAAMAELGRVRLRQMRASAAFAGLYALVLGGGFWYVAVSAGAGQLTLGDVALYLNAVAQAEAHLMQVGFWFGYVHEALLYLRGFFAFERSARPAVALAPAGRALPAPAALRAGIELRHVRFCYPETAREVLTDVTAVLPAGKVTALVGANGAGKSTLVKLLTRMYDPVDGEILLDGAPLAAYELESLRRRTAVVYQDFARFALSLRENVAVGAVEAAPSARRIEEVSRWSGADEVAAALPAGYETELTRRFAGGVELSGGEWQKVALARGFLRDAALVVLDEPSAALDAEAEHRLFERFRELVAGRTALLISHRFSTVRMADHILVLEGGRVLEAGGHTELVARGGRYAELFEMQAGRYR
jgi:ATP-binding cassette subfamily B protein